MRDPYAGRGQGGSRYPAPNRYEKPRGILSRVKYRNYAFDVLKRERFGTEIGRLQMKRT